jgi:hypothetical protein
MLESSNGPFERSRDPEASVDIITINYSDTEGNLFDVPSPSRAFSSSESTWTSNPFSEFSRTTNYKRRRIRDERRRRNPSEETVPLSKLSDEEFLERANSHQLEFEQNRIRRVLETRRYHVEEEEERRRHNQEYWNAHRAENPRCECQRCMTYRGQTDEEAEDALGW